MQIYDNPLLGFSIGWPDHWQQIPAAWMQQFIGRASGTSQQLAECLERMREPFLVAHDPTAPAGLPIPAVKCQAYNTTSIAAIGGIRALLASIIAQLQQVFPDFELHQCEPECLIAGVVGARLSASMPVMNPQGEWFHGLSELLILPTTEHVFVVGLSASSDPQQRPHDELLAIQRSIRLRRGLC